MRLNSTEKNHKTLNMLLGKTIRILRNYNFSQEKL